MRMADEAWRWAKGYPPVALIRHDACHLFDLLRHFTGSVVKSLLCPDARPDDDALLIGFENGATATLLHSGHRTRSPGSQPGFVHPTPLGIWTNGIHSKK